MVMEHMLSEILHSQIIFIVTMHTKAQLLGILGLIHCQKKTQIDNMLN